MEFVKIDRADWTRKEYFEHYFSSVPCTYSMTVSLDVTAVRQSGQKLYPVLLHSLTAVVNRHPEFRTALNSRGELGVYSEMIPSYTVFHPETETFSILWTEYSEDRAAFCAGYERDLLLYGKNPGMMAKPNPPENLFNVSMIPWTSFEGFNLNLQKGYEYLLPIFTIGRYREQEGRFVLPLAVQVHHAVCDGFHLSRFVQELQQQIQG